jgi:hypothetical protein
MSAPADARPRAALLVALAFAWVVLAPAAARAQEAAPPPVQTQEVAAPAAPQPQSVEPSLEEKLQFLAKARVTEAKQTKKGITAPVRLTMSDGTLAHAAVFQSVDEKKVEATFRDGRREMMFRDYWGFNVAAFRLAVLLGYPDLVPATVERSFRGRTGCFVWWVNGAIDQQDIKEKGLTAPDAVAYSREIMRSRVFGALFGDTDRNLTNNLFTPDWRLVLIDFTRAFRLHHEVERPENLRGIDRRLLESMQALTRESVREHAGRYLNGAQIDALLKRRDALVAHFTRLVADKGEAAVLYD